MYVYVCACAYQNVAVYVCMRGLFDKVCEFVPQCASSSNVCDYRYKLYHCLCRNLQEHILNCIILAFSLNRNISNLFFLNNFLFILL